MSDKLNINCMLSENAMTYLQKKYLNQQEKEAFEIQMKKDFIEANPHLFPRIEYNRLSETKAMYEIKRKTIMDDIFNNRDNTEKIENLSKVKSMIENEIEEIDKNMKQIEEQHLELMKPKMMNKIYNMIENPEKKNETKTDDPDGSNGPDCSFCRTPYDKLDGIVCQLGYFLCKPCNRKYKEASIQEISVIKKFLPHDFDEGFVLPVEVDEIEVDE